MNAIFFIEVGVCKKGATMKIESFSSVLDWYRQIFWHHQKCYLPPSWGSVYLLIPLYQGHIYLPWPNLLYTFSVHMIDYFPQFLNISKFFPENGLALKTCLLSIKTDDTILNGVCFYFYSSILLIFPKIQFPFSICYEQSETSALYKKVINGFISTCWFIPCYSKYKL